MPAISSQPPALSTSSPPHLIIPFAVCSAESWLPVMKAMPAKNTRYLSQLLHGMKLVQTDAQEVNTLSPPHERALAKAQGLASTPSSPDGLIPWAARDALRQLPAVQNKAWAWVTPCHWAMGREHATLSDPAALNLREDESRTLLAAMQPYFETDGITLHYLTPERWLAEGELFRDLPTASLDRVLGRSVDPWLVNSKTLRRLQNEMQMLLYTHAVNDERAAQRQWPVNSFWLSGTGSLPDLPLTQTLIKTLEAASISAPRSLAQAVFNNDWPAYGEAWAALDAGEVAQLLTRQRAGERVRLTLCGERATQTYKSSQPGLMNKATAYLTSLGVLSPKALWEDRIKL